MDELRDPLGEACDLLRQIEVLLLGCPPELALAFPLTPKLSIFSAMAEGAGLRFRASPPSTILSLLSSRPE